MTVCIFFPVKYINTYTFGKKHTLKLKLKRFLYQPLEIVAVSLRSVVHRVPARGDVAGGSVLQGGRFLGVGWQVGRGAQEDPRLDGTQPRSTCRACGRIRRPAECGIEETEGMEFPWDWSRLRCPVVPKGGMWSEGGAPAHPEGWEESGLVRKLIGCASFSLSLLHQ